MSLEARRFLALHLPDFATDRMHRAESDLRFDEPLAIWVKEGPRRIVVAVNAAAAEAGLRPGQALADVQAIAPSLSLRPADFAGDARMLHRLALWARRFTPLAAVDPPDGLLLDITGCAHLLGGEAGLMQDALARLRRAGFAVRGAVAGAAATAGALARARSDAPIVVNGAEAVNVGPLPLGLALRLDADLALTLARLGMRRVGDLQALSRASLARRFGVELLHRLDAVTGQRREAMHPIQPLPELAVTQDLAEPVVTRAGIEAMLDRLLEALGDKLREAGRGARQVTLLAWRMDGEVQEVAVRAGQPTRTAAHLRYLFRDRLEGLEPGLGFERMALEARATDPMATGLQTVLA
ncbi:MAG: DNA polymerase Y family protein, partial [Acetobacteraceae bacterium]